MNNLIIAVISIALVLILSSVGVFFGGEVYKNNQVEGAIAKFTNESSQISAAIVLYESSGATVDSGFNVHELVDEGYLQSIPEGWSIRALGHSGAISTEIAEREADFSESVCFKMNQNAGYEFNVADDLVLPYSGDETLAIPLCTKEDISSVPCCISGA
ncbi:hypothetical protein LMH73_009345 [Vibrio splendidus]|nr:hypothetical protein [Vibrio splendidus]MCC4881862.1 hypothetical protein [Vibrio splendidus]